MIRRLVKLDPENGGRFAEVDPILVRRKALELKGYIERYIDPDNDPYGIYKNALPLCTGTLDGSLKLPMMLSDDPFLNPALNDLLPHSFQDYWARFIVPATGCHREDPEGVVIDGIGYDYLTFEEPGDWTEVVKQYENNKEERWRKKVNWTEEKRRLVDSRIKQRQEMLAIEELRMAEELRVKRLAKGT